MAVPPAGTRRTSRSGSAGAASARGLSQYQTVAQCVCGVYWMPVDLLDDDLAP